MATSAPLTRASIIDDAVALADVDGVSALSMRRLAQRLGCGAMSLYNHVRDKDDLLEAMVERILGDGPPEPQDLVGWRGRLGAIATWLRSVLVAHPWACQLWYSAFPGPARTRYMEAVLGTLRAGGFSRRMAHHGYHALDLHVVGHASQETTFAIGITDPEAAMLRFLEQTPVERFPHVIEHVAHHTDPDVEEDDFAFLLDLLLDGLDRHRQGT